MKTLTILCAAILAFSSQRALAQHASDFTIVSDPSSWYVDTPSGPAPSPEALIIYPEITTIPGPIPEHWNVTRLDPWTEARVVWLHGTPSVVTWGSSRVLPNWHEYRTPFAVMANGRPYYTRADLPKGHSLHSEFHMADLNRDGRIGSAEHNRFFSRR